MIGKKDLHNYNRGRKSRRKQCRRFGKDKFNARQQAQWFLLLGDLLQNGFSIKHAVIFTVNDVLTDWPQLQSVPEQMAQGKNFAEAVQPFVKPALYHQLILTEQHGDLEGCLLNVGRVMKLKEHQQEKLRGILTYPCLLSVMLVLMFVLLRIFVFPELDQWSASNNVPAFVEPLVTVGWVALGVCLLLATGFIFRLRRAGKIQRATMLSRLPIIGRIFQSYYGYYLTINLTMLLESGLSLREVCHSLIHSEGETLLSAVAGEYQPLLEDGQALEQVLRRHRFVPKELALIIQKGTVLNREIRDLNAVSQILFKRLTSSTERLLVFLPPILFGVLAIVIISMYLSLLWPIYQSMQGVIQ